MTKEKKHLVELKNIGKIYDTNNLYTIGIRHIDLGFDLNEFVTIEGESGSGKSTLLNVIAANDTYEEGEMFFKGTETSHYSELEWDKYRERNISFIFQDFNIVENLTVLENVELALFYLEDANKRKELATDLINKVGLAKQINQKTSKLSGGEKQRTVIARALAKNSPIILADEPTGNLDSKSAMEIAALLKEVSKDKLVIVVTHNAEYFDKYSTRKIVLHDGGVVSDKPNNVKEEEIPQIDIEIKEDKKEKNRKNVLWLGGLNYKSRPKFTALMSAISVTFSIALFFIIALFSNRIIEPIRQTVSENPIAGKTIVKKVSSDNFSKSEYDKLLDEVHANFAFKNSEFSEINITTDETDEYKSQNITCLYDPYKHDLKEGEAVMYLPYSLAHYEGHLKKIFNELNIGVKKIKVKKMLEQGKIRVYFSKNTLYKYGLNLKYTYSLMQFGNHNLKVYKYAKGDGLKPGEIRLINLKYWAGDLSEVFLAAFASQKFKIINTEDTSVDKSIPGLAVEMNSDDYEKVFNKGIPFGNEVSLYYKNNKTASQRTSSISGQYGLFKSDEKVYKDKAADTFILNVLAYVGLIVSGILLGILVSIIFAKNVGVLSGDFAIYRTLGISRRDAKASLYIQMLFIFLPNIILLPLVSLIATIIPNSTLSFISPWNYLIIEAIMLAIVEIVAFRFNKKIFKTSIRKSLSRGSK